MIRDPSDGSVKPPLSKHNEFNPEREFPGSYGPVIDPATSGLPAAAARDADRHQRSKEWLAEYRKTKPKAPE